MVAAIRAAPVRLSLFGHYSLIARVPRRRCGLRLPLDPPRRHIAYLLLLSPPGLLPRSRLLGKPSRTWRRNIMTLMRSCLKMQVCGMSPSLHDPCRNGLLLEVPVRLAGTMDPVHYPWNIRSRRSLFHCHRPTRVIHRGRIEKRLGRVPPAPNVGKYPRAIHVFTRIIT